MNVLPTRSRADIAIRIRNTQEDKRELSDTKQIALAEVEISLLENLRDTFDGIDIRLLREKCGSLRASIRNTQSEKEFERYCLQLSILNWFLKIR